MSGTMFYRWTYDERQLLTALVNELNAPGEKSNLTEVCRRIQFCFPDRTACTLRSQLPKLNEPVDMVAWDTARHELTREAELTRNNMGPERIAMLLKLKATGKSWAYIAGETGFYRTDCRLYWMVYEWKTPGDLELKDGKINLDKFLALERLEKATAGQAAQAQEDSQQVQAPMNALGEEVVPTDSQRLPDARPVPVVQEPARPTQFNPIQPPPYPILPNPLDVQSTYTHATQPYPPQLQPVQARPTSAPSLPVLPRSDIDKEMIARLDSELGFDF